MMKCNYFELNLCKSCPLIETEYTNQLQNKQHSLTQKLIDFKPEAILPPIASHEFGFRNKAKMAVLGTVEKPILGITNHAKQTVDLCDCPLYPEAIKKALVNIKAFIKLLKLVPYNLNKKKGDIKFIILTHHENKFMLRFVLNNKDKIDKIKASITHLKQLIIGLEVISINIQPVHAAILEGKEEIILTEQATFPVTLNAIPLFIRPQSFFQTNTLVASKLYATAKQWITQINNCDSITTIWDLFCGVGGFGLHCTNQNQQLTGIEISPEAIECAKKSAKLLALSNTTFRSLDSTEFALSQQDRPDLVLVNPPRRGLGRELTTYLEKLSPQYIIYSSCNSDTLTNDLQTLSSYSITKVQLFDMFPHTEHTEVLVMLKRH
ncbi:23S rRNA (uracil(747)-C(5))-methyltransferase RlmC [Orbaceae bacterium ac157xtp]